MKKKTIISHHCEIILFFLSADLLYNPCPFILFLLKLHPVSKNRKPRLQLFQPATILRSWISPTPKSIEHVGTLVDVFASFVALDGSVDAAEAEVALDLLRHAYPEADHGWLARRLQRAFRSPSSTQSLADQITKEMGGKSITSLGLQLYLLIDASTSKKRGLEAFMDLLIMIGKSDLGMLICDEMNDRFHADELLPFTRVIFSASPEADVRVPPQAAHHAFRLYRNDQIIILRNTGEHTLWVGGTAVISGQILRLRSHQRLSMPDWTLSADDLNFFLTCKQQNESRSLFIHETTQGLIVERSKSRQSSMLVKFDTKVTLSVIRPSDISIEGHPTNVEILPTELSLHDKLNLSDGKKVTLEHLRRQAMEAGGRFKLDQSEQTVIASNDPSLLKKGDLLLSPGLAGKVVLKIKFNPETSVGELEVVSAERGVFVRNQLIRQSCELSDGMLIRLSSSQGIRCRFTDGFIDEERTVIRELMLDGVSHQFNESDTETALDNVEFAVSRGEMLCIIGPSGCGKSTLLTAIAGQLKPTRGHIRLNGISLYNHRERLAPFITYMPQEEALNANLTVREHLKHACSIRRPQISYREQSKRIDSILGELALQPLAHRKVGSPGDKSISGGERGRLNLGLDLGSAAEILLFDEPISGLSSKDSEHVAETLKSTAQDKIVIASLHRPGSSVLSLFDKILLLDKGGRIAFFGTSGEMFEYFKNACLELQIPVRRRHNLEQDSAADFVFDVLETPLHNLTQSNNSDHARRFPPRFWQERFESHRLLEGVASGEIPAQTHIGDAPRADDNMPIPISRQRTLKDHVILFQTHLRRSVLSKFRNRGTLYSTILEAPLLAFLIGITLRASEEGRYDFGASTNLIEYLFLSVTVGMFLGLTNSATEILRDKPVLRRERNHRYGTGIYIIAKFSTLALLAIIQSGIYIAVGNHMLEIESMFFYHWFWMSLTAIVGTAMALLISSIVNTERAALSAVPLLLVPQLLLAGALVQFEDMNRGLFQGGEKSREEGAEPFPSKLMPLRYAFEGIIITQATKNWYFRNTHILLSKRDWLKEQVDPDTGETNLTDEQLDRLAILTLAIQRADAAEAPDRATAKTLTKKIVRLGLIGTMQELEDLSVRDENNVHPACQSYYKNEKLGNVTKITNSTRASNALKRDEENDLDDPEDGLAATNSVFLDEWKFWYGKPVSTLKWCLGILGLITSTCLILSILIITKWNRKVT
ncbi:MAG: ABC-type multidrug transport system ATPase subunit [Rubritalea sp.]|jgi:ABC-type multidrug transport system ATPase subunit